ncbi:MAG TPA: UDP-N-acetylglucosamine 2-epimerase (non-hydrolyzing) [Vampirovibrionales bacterium]
MKKTLKIVFGTRPELIKLAPLIRLIKGLSFNCKEFSGQFDCTVISTGQHKELLSNLYEWFGFKPDIELNVMKENQTPSQVVSNILAALDEHVANSDCVVVQGDTATAFASSLAGFMQKIPVAHIEAGLRTNNPYNPFPEEMLRRLISQVTTFHFPPADKALDNLKRVDIQDNVYVVGNTVIDALKETTERLEALEKKDGNAFQKAVQLPQSIVNELQEPGRKLVLVTMHRRENHGEEHSQVAKALKQISSKYPEALIVFPVHPNPNVKKAIEPHLSGLDNVCLLEPLDYVTFSWLLKKAFILVTDSGGLQEEGTFLKKPVLVLRETTERPEAIYSGYAKLIGTKEEVVFSEIEALLREKQAEFVSPPFEVTSSLGNLVFGNGDASEQILQCLAQKL